MKFISKFLNTVGDVTVIEPGINEAELLLFFFVMYFAVLLTMLVFAIVTIIATWRIFTKAGIPGWYALIPVYNIYIMYKHFWSVGAFKRLLVWSIISAVLAAVMELIPMGDEVYTALYLVSAVVSLLSFFNVFGLNYRLARSFDRGFFFALGLSFLAPFFDWILGLGDCDYVGDAYDYYY